MQTLTLKVQENKFQSLLQILQALDFVEIEQKKKSKPASFHKNIQNSAELYADIYENDSETQDWTKAALSSWE